MKVCNAIIYYNALLPLRMLEVVAPQSILHIIVEDRQWSSWFYLSCISRATCFCILREVNNLCLPFQSGPVAKAGAQPVNTGVLAREGADVGWGGVGGGVPCRARGRSAARCCASALQKCWICEVEQKNPKKAEKSSKKKRIQNERKYEKKLKETKRSFNLIEEKLPKEQTKVDILMKQRRYYWLQSIKATTFREKPTK